MEQNRAWFTDYITEDACAELEQQKGQLYKTFKAVNMSHIRCPLPKVKHTFVFNFQVLIIMSISSTERLQTSTSRYKNAGRSKKFSDQSTLLGREFYDVS